MAKNSASAVSVCTELRPIVPIRMNVLSMSVTTLWDYALTIVMSVMRARVATFVQRVPCVMLTVSVSPIRWSIAIQRLRVISWLAVIHLQDFAIIFRYPIRVLAPMGTLALKLMCVFRGLALEHSPFIAILLISVIPREFVMFRLAFAQTHRAPMEHLATTASSVPAEISVSEDSAPTKASIHAVMLCGIRNVKMLSATNL